MKYVSIDLETTGLSPIEHQVVEIGAVIDDTEKPGVNIKDLPTFRCLIVEQDWRVGPYTAWMHAALWEEMKNVDVLALKDIIWTDSGYCYARRDRALSAFRMWLIQEELDPESVICAGKNFNSFDKGFLSEMWGYSELGFKHRAFDPVTFWTLPEDAEPPNMATCCKRADIPLVGHHTAVEDARTVIKLLRRQWHLQKSLNQ